MTEQQLRAVEGFENLPVYDEDDEGGCESLLRVQDTRFEGTVAEAEDGVQFNDLLRDPRYVPRGAIRYSDDDVRAVFWLKREDGRE
jgi:hypothetical protein